MSPSVPLGVSKRPPTVKGVAPQKNRRGGILNYPLPSEKRGGAEKEGRGSFKAQGLPPSCYFCGGFLGGRKGGGGVHEAISKYAGIFHDFLPLSMKILL